MSRQLLTRLAKALPTLIVVALLQPAPAVLAADQGDSVEALISRAAALARVGQMFEAGQKLEQAWAASATATQRAQVRLAQGDLASTISSSPTEAATRVAEAFYGQAIELADDDAIIRVIAVNSLAVLLIESDRPTAAVTLMEAYLESVPTEARPQFFYNYGLAQEGAGNPAEAFVAYETAARGKPDFAALYQAAIRLSSRFQLPTSLQLALSLVRTAREAGEWQHVESLLMAFLMHRAWFELPGYEHGLLGELLLFLGSGQQDVEQRKLRWLSLLDNLAAQLQRKTGAKIAAVARALTIETFLRAENPWSAWRKTGIDRRQFSGFLKNLGDQELRESRWAAALIRYRAAWEFNRESLEAAAYLLNVLAVGPSDLEPTGQLAFDVFEALQRFQPTESASELAGTYQLAAAALDRRNRTADARAAWNLARDLYAGSQISKPEPRLEEDPTAQGSCSEHRGSEVKVLYEHLLGVGLSSYNLVSGEHITPIIAGKSVTERRNDSQRRAWANAFDKIDHLGLSYHLARAAYVEGYRTLRQENATAILSQEIKIHQESETYDWDRCQYIYEVELLVPAVPGLGRFSAVLGELIGSLEIGKLSDNRMEIDIAQVVDNLLADPRFTEKAKLLMADPSFREELQYLDDDTQRSLKLLAREDVEITGFAVGQYRISAIVSSVIQQAVTPRVRYFLERYDRVEVTCWGYTDSVPLGSIQYNGYAQLRLTRDREHYNEPDVSTPPLQQLMRSNSELSIARAYEGAHALAIALGSQARNPRLLLAYADGGEIPSTRVDGPKSRKIKYVIEGRNR